METRQLRTDTSVRLAAAFIVGLVGLILEIAYTRVISYKFFYFYTYLVIGLALLGLGAAAVAVAFSRRLRSIDSFTLMRVLLPAAGAVGLVSYVAVGRIPTRANDIWVGTIPEALAQVGLLVLIALSLTAVFFALGVVLSALIVVEAAEMRRLYFWDLAGAAIACLIAIPLIGWVGPPALIVGSSVLLAVFGLLVGVHQARHRLRLSAVAGLVLLVSIPVAGLDIRIDEAKTLQDPDAVIAGDWGPVFRVDAVEQDGTVVLMHDALWGSAIWRYDGTEATSARFFTDSRRLPVDALGRAPRRILIIGAAGGNEIQHALGYGVEHIDAVELNPVTVGLLNGEFKEFSGSIVDDPRVNYVRGDGRTFLARSKDLYDVIWFVAPDSYAANNAATSGAFVLSESYLYTEEMIEESLSHLTPEGMVVAQFGDFSFDTRPTRTARYLATARSAMGGTEGAFADRTMLVIDQPDFAIARISSIFLFRSPVPDGAGERVEASVAAQLPESRVLYVPGLVSEPGISTDIITGGDAEVDALVDSYAFDISPVTDDKPFFWHFTPFPDVVKNFERNYEESEIAIGERLIVALVATAALVALVLLGLPFVVGRSRSGADAIGPRRRAGLLVYFAALGFGFMLVEISMIQRFALLLGYPTLSLSVSLFTLLLSTALGARLSDRTFGRGGWRLASGAGVLTAIVGLYLLISDDVTETALAWSSSARIATAFALLFPVGLVLGAFLPAGIDAARRIAGERPEADEGRLVAWCWAVNGFFSVMGSSITTVSSMTFGFDRTVVIGVVLYWVAIAVLADLSRQEKALA